MRRCLFALAIVIGFVVQAGPPAMATGSGGWDHLGDGGTTKLPALNGHVNALNTDNPRVLYVGGPFTDAGGKANADFLARWDGTSWGAVSGSARLNGSVDAIAYHAGHVYVGGQFTNVGGNDNIDYLAEWTGSTWKSPCVGTTANPITAHVAALQIVGNTLYVGGAFQDGGGLGSADFLVACDLDTGAASSTVAHEGDFNSGVLALTADSNGTLYAGGGFINLGGVTGLDHVASYQGGTWHQMGATQAVDDKVRSLTAQGTDVYVGTDAVDIGGIPQADHIARWDAQGLFYSALGADSTGTNGWFDSFAFLDGMVTYGSLLVVAGSFQNAGGNAAADDIAYFDGTRWRPLGSNGAGNGPLNSSANALAVFDRGIVAGGGFTNAGGDGLADGIGSHTIARADARVATASTGPFTGNNVYSPTGSGQAESLSVRRGHSGHLFVDVQNDGLTAGSLKVSGPDGSHGFALTYFRGSSNVTSQVRNGTFSTGSLTPQAHVTLKVVVAVAQDSARSGTFLVTARTPGSPADAVKLKVDAR